MEYVWWTLGSSHRFVEGVSVPWDAVFTVFIASLKTLTLSQGSDGEEYL